MLAIGHEIKMKNKNIAKVNSHQCIYSNGSLIYLSCEQNERKLKYEIIPFTERGDADFCERNVANRVIKEDQFKTGQSL